MTTTTTTTTAAGALPVMASPAGPGRAVPAREAYPGEVPGLRFTPAASGLWRVATADGTLLGHIERRPVAGGERYRSRRLLPGLVRSQDLGEFWSPRDAAEVFR
ncbi:hypothetical protein GE115_01945 [Agromyces sp. CFH 90414]|uniref:Uncharacterized protein n=1 Tax=Agromyces agglutinans TaxID=2662258 RepID=A0A6I2F219_9MICO|nr:hypothetical protein [Agromyces agglutinans]MRG58639.1 hypothetical protein [Agromyces agglutinans]